MNELEKIVYDIICSDDRPSSEDEHWEGYTAKRIVAALKPLIAAAEREACAKVCEREYDNFLRDDESELADAAMWCADAIRARGQHDKLD